MTYDELVEKVARAIYATLEGAVSNQDYRRQMLQWDRSKECARAAIAAVYEALKEPGEDELEAGRTAWKKPRLRVSHAASDEFMTCSVIYGAMLAASPMNPER